MKRVVAPATVVVATTAVAMVAAVASRAADVQTTAVAIAVAATTAAAMVAAVAVLLRLNLATTLRRFHLRRLLIQTLGSPSHAR